MGFLDKVTNKVTELAKKAKCATGFHAGTFVPINGQPKCHKEKTCPDCGNHVTAIEHKFPDWKSVEYKEYRSCLKKRKCEYCQHEERKEIHEGFENTWKKDDYCFEIEICTRCEHKKRGSEKHIWEKKIGNYDDDTVTEYCIDCRKERTRKKIKTK